VSDQTEQIAKQLMIQTNESGLKLFDKGIEVTIKELFLYFIQCFKTYWQRRFNQRRRLFRLSHDKYRNSEVGGITITVRNINRS
jgi:hypothetical protein